MGGLTGGMAAYRSVQNIFRVRLLIGNTTSKIYIYICIYMCVYIYTASEFCQFLVFACETVSVIIRRGHSLTVWEQGAGEKCSRHKSDVTTRELRKLHDEQLRNF